MRLRKRLNDAWVAACHVPVLSVIMWDTLSKI